MNIFKSCLLSAISILAVSSAAAQEPDGYYSACEGSSGSALLTKLKNKISSHKNVGYDGLWEVYNDADVDENGKIWDIYSTKRWTQGKEHCGNYSKVGDCINREHSVPQSWFSEAKPMKSDAFHVYPTDGKVNGQRSDFPYGECANGTTLPSNGGVDALGKLGTCTFAGYSGKVFEPVDEYKGDIARSYFYMVTCYNDKISRWGGDMFGNSSYPGLNTWALNLLLKWHRQDPVSEKEIKRNNGIYKHQKNRNPFIDHPELVEHIWGNKSTTAWYINSTPDPTFVLPVDGSSVDFGTIALTGYTSASVNVKAEGLTSNVTVTVDAAGVTASRYSIPYNEACSTSGANLTLSWSPQSQGALSGTITFSTDGAQTKVNLAGTAVDGLPALAAADITSESFTARWIYVGDADARDCYTLHVLKDGSELSGYPKDVTAASQQYTVTGLDQFTTYTYYLVSASMTSDRVNVTTSEIIPTIDASIEQNEFSTTPETPSAYALVELDIQNITDDVEATVTAPFEISTDRTTWTQHAVFSASATALYVRLGATSAGHYESTLIISSGDIVNDAIELQGTAAVAPTGGTTYFVADGYELTGADSNAVIVTLYNPGKSTQATNDITKNKDKTLAAEGHSHSSEKATITFSEGTNTSYGPVVWYSSGKPAKHLRMYTGNTFTITPAASQQVVKVEILSNNNTPFKVGQTTITPTYNVTTYTHDQKGAVTFTATDSTRPSYIAVSTEGVSSIIDTVVSPAAEEATYYDLRGIRVAAPIEGEVYIKVTSRGAQKVVF